MILAVDVYYSENKAKSVGVLFHGWADRKPAEIVTTYTDNPLAYEPGSFYKRELPCLQDLFCLVDMSQIQVIIVDSYVYLDDEKKPGLGYHVYASLDCKIPVVGVAKTTFHNNLAHVKEVCRGKSAKPLYVTAVGMDLELAAKNVQNMYGDFRFPHLLKLLDTKTKET